MEFHNVSVFENILKKSQNAVAILDKESRILNINDKFTELFQFKINEVKGKKISELICIDEIEEQVEENLNFDIEGVLIRQQIKRKRKDGKLIDIEFFAYPIIINNKIMGANVVYSDISYISDKKKIAEKIKQLSQKDKLTGLNNRYYFKEQLDLLISKSNKEKDTFGLLFLDLDNFKEINDTLGHLTGDRVLVHFSNRIQKIIGKNDLFARFAGDEFVLLIKENKTKQQLARLAKKILDVLEEPFIINNNEIYLYASIGIVMYPYDGEESDTLIKNADIAMYKAKQNMEYEYKIRFFSEKMKKETEENFAIINHLRKAVDNNEFFLCYQPIIKIKNNEIVGAEALLRWNNKKFGLVPPSKFIPIAENTGHIHKIEKWVFEKVCRQLNDWKKKGIRLLPIAVNISVKQLEDNKFTKFVIKTIADYEIDSKNIEFEITESVSAGNMDKITKNIKELGSMGIKISMDDFGTGYSSLSMLKKLYVDKLKIDKIFIDDIENSTDNSKLLKTIIIMAKNFNLEVVAEGIENYRQLEFLKELGCDFGQGYLFSEPIDSTYFERLLKTNHLKIKI